MDAAQFAQRFITYFDEASEARDRGVHHDERRRIFLDFLHDAFDIGRGDIELEQYIQLRDQRVQMKNSVRIRKGWIDAIFGDLIFEFKRDYKREEADGLRELRDYLSNIPNGEQCIGLLTDGFKITAYALDAAEANGLQEINQLT